MSDISVKLLDGAERKLKEGANSLDLANEISSGLKKRVVASIVNGVVTDAQDPLKDGDQVVLLDAKSSEAKDIIFHSCEHILAAAVVDLFENAQVTMGPKDHSEGFYYDFDIGRPFNDEDLVRIEEKMTDLIKKSVEFKKKWLTKSQAKDLFFKLGQKYKKEIIDWIEDDIVTVYECGNFIDLCRGPHLPKASFIKAFKLLGVSGCYWRGDSNREMLQRIYGVAFFDKNELLQYLHRIEEAKRRDHRKLGPKHGLFFVSERFGSVLDEETKISEIKIVVYVSEQVKDGGKINEILKQVEGLVSDIKSSLPSKSLLTKGITILSKTEQQQEPNVVDLRIHAVPSDADGRKIIADRVTSFNEGSKDLTAKCHFETHFSEEIGPGLVMWLPNGGLLRSLIEDFARKKHLLNGYQMVYSPHIAKSDLWRISGHLQFYKDSMFSPMDVDGVDYLLKPMNCPFHVLMYKFRPRSYRDLPIRLAEFGTVYRYELAGVLHGLMRVRGFTQDDAHIFCRWDQLEEELDKVLSFVLKMLNSFGFLDFEVNVSTRPEKYVGEVSFWEKAENSLINAVKRTKLSYKLDEGGGAFYGPKVDVKLRDSLSRLWQCSTLQLDFNNPTRFDLQYVASNGIKEQPVMLHRALFGSIERFIGILIEHYAGAFPPWLCPEQVRILTVSDRQNDFAKELLLDFTEAGIRAQFNPSDDKLSAKIREAQIDKVPFMVIVGDKEVLERGGTLRLRSQENKGFFKKAALVKEIVEQCLEPT